MVNDINTCSFVVAVPKRNVTDIYVYFKLESESNIKAEKFNQFQITSSYDVDFVNRFLEHIINEDDPSKPNQVAIGNPDMGIDQRKWKFREPFPGLYCNHIRK